MLMTAATFTLDPRKHDDSAYPTIHDLVTLYSHETTPPVIESFSDPDDIACSPTRLPSGLPDDLPPLGLRLEQLVHAHIPVAAAITRINNLKHIRYTLHWQTGDHVRDTVAELVKEHCLSDSWTMAYDHAEFLTVMPACLLSEATERARQWQQAIAEYPWEILHPALQVTVDVGVAAQDPLEDYEALLANADIALRCRLS